MSILSDNPSTTPSRRSLLVVFLVVITLYFLRFGYDFGISDQDEFIPYLMRMLNPNFLANDWFLNLQADQWNVRSGFVLMLFPLAKLLPIWLVLILVYLGSAYLITTSIFTLAFRATGNTTASTVAVVLILVGTPYWNLGGNEFMNRMLVPSMLAWGFALWGIDRLILRKMLSAGLLMGLATWAQPLVGLQVAAIGGIFVLVRELRKSNGPGGTRWRRDFLVLLGSFIIVGSPVLVPIIVGQISGTGNTDTLYIMTAFRSPHHYLPDSFPSGSVSRFFFLTFAGTTSFVVFRQAFNPEIRRDILLLIVILYAILAAAFFGTAVLNIPLIINIQLFKVSVLAKALLLVGVSGALIRVPRIWDQDRISAWIRHPFSPSFMLVILISVVVLAARWNPMTNRSLRFIVRDSGTTGEMLEWVRTSTDEASIFAAPPSFSGFQSRARRAVFVNFKAFPFTHAGMEAWYDRLTRLAPIPPLRRGGTKAIIELDESYSGLTASEIRTFSRTEDISYFLRSAPVLQTPGQKNLEPVFRNKDWWIYRSHTTQPDPH